jgi:hypothetical protein
VEQGRAAPAGHGRAARVPRGARAVCHQEVTEEGGGGGSMHVCADVCISLFCLLLGRQGAVSMHVCALVCMCVLACVCM